MYRLLFALDWRKDATIVRDLLRNPGRKELMDAFARLSRGPHSYPNHLLDVLIAHLPRIKAGLTDGDLRAIAETLESTARWEIHQRDRQLMT